MKKRNYKKKEENRRSVFFTINFRDPPVPQNSRYKELVERLMHFWFAFPPCCPFFLLSLPVRHARALILPCSSRLSENGTHLRRCIKCRSPTFSTGQAVPGGVGSAEG